MQINLKNKNAIVTGGSRGIGKAIVETLVSCGANVALQYNQNKNRALKVKKELGPKVNLFQCDFSDGLAVGAFFNTVIKEMKYVDILVNNAGVALRSDPNQDDVGWIDDWLRTMDVNLHAAGLLCKKAVQHFTSTKGGTIINISSRAAFRGDAPDYMAYAASKSGLIGLTRTIARAYGKQGVKAFLVTPGFVQTDMAQAFIDEYGEEFVTQDLALDELTKPTDVANLVAFLASGYADHSTGGTFDINGGSYMR